ncbi:MAG TPA: hypothetical protein VF982_00155, partial [Anaerolineales bacterium]
LSFTHTDLSHWVLPEAALAMMSALALWLILKYHAAPFAKHAAIAALVCGLAISTKYNAGLLVLPLLLAVGLKQWGDWKAAAGHAALAIGCLAAGFLLGSPYWLISFESYWSVLQYTFSHVDAGMVGHMTAAPVIGPLFDLIVNDWTVGVLAVTGLVYALTRRESHSLLLLAFALPTVVVVGLWQRSGVHYLAPVLPALAVLAGVFLSRLLKETKRPAARAALLALLFVHAFLKIAHHDICLSRTDTRTHAQKWIEQHLPLESMVAYENYVYGPNLFDPARFVKNEEEGGLVPGPIKERLLAESLRRRTYRLVNLRKDFKLKFLAEAPDSSNDKNAYVRQLLENRLPRLSSVAKAGVPYLVASSDNYFRYFDQPAPPKGTPVWLSYNNGRRFYQSLFESESWRMLQEFTPGFWTPGPTIRVYGRNPEAGPDEE